MPKRVLVIDVGGTNVKVGMSGRKRLLKLPSGPTMTAAQMVSAVKKATADWSYDAVSIGYPGPVRRGRSTAEPKNLGGGWVRCDFRKEFRRPVKVVNDAVLQALGNYHGGRILFIGFGTGIGSTIVAEGVLMPVDVAQLMYRNNRAYEDYVGRRARKRLGVKRWSRHVLRMAEDLRRGLQVDEIVLGGGDAKKIVGRLRRHIIRADPAKAILGGVRLWAPVATWLRISEPKRARQQERR